MVLHLKGLLLIIFLKFLEVYEEWMLTRRNLRITIIIFVTSALAYWFRVKEKTQYLSYKQTGNLLALSCSISRWLKSKADFLSLPVLPKFYAAVNKLLFACATFYCRIHKDWGNQFPREWFSSQGILKAGHSVCLKTGIHSSQF